MAVDYFLKIDQIEGESKDSKHANELQLLSWSWGESNSGSAGTGTGSGAGKVNMSDFSFMIQQGKSSPKLKLHCAAGTHLANAVLTCRKAGGSPTEPGLEYYTVTFNEVLISSYQISGSSEIPMESVSFNFVEIDEVYKPQLPDGSLGDNITFKWNVATNVGE